MQQFGKKILARPALALQKHGNGRLGNSFQLLSGNGHLTGLAEKNLNRGQIAETG
jgi:hypothetical protein